MLSFPSAVVLTTLLAAVSSVQAQAAGTTTETVTVGSPQLNHCLTAPFKYTCTAPPCMLIIRPSNDSGESYALWSGLTEASGSIPWAPYVPAGANVTAYIYDAGGNPNYSGALIVGEGSQTCEENLGYAVTDGVTSTAQATGAAAATSGSSKAAASTSAGSANATSSAAEPASTDSGASKIAQGTAAFALLGAGIAALLV